MKRSTCILLISLAMGNTLIGQDIRHYKPFQVDLGMGPVVASGEPTGILLAIEPSYCFANYFKTGIRLEESILNMKTIGSTALTFDFYFPHTRGFRLFAGTGYSYFNTTTSGGCSPGPTNIKTVSRTSYSGALIRTGMEVFHFRLGFEYNFVPPTHLTYINANGQTNSAVNYQNSYFGIKASLFIGGGKK